MHGSVVIAEPGISSAGNSGDWAIYKPKPTQAADRESFSRKEIRGFCLQPIQWASLLEGLGYLELGSILAQRRLVTGLTVLRGIACGSNGSHGTSPSRRNLAGSELVGAPDRGPGFHSYYGAWDGKFMNGGIIMKLRSCSSAAVVTSVLTALNSSPLRSETCSWAAGAFC